MLSPTTTLQFVDETTGTILPLTSTGDLYTVNLTASTGTNESRFKIRVTTISSTDDLSSSGIHLWAEFNTCHVGGLTEGATITIHDISGRRMVSAIAASSKWSTRLPAGIYTVTVESQGVVANGKIIIQK